MTLTTEAAMHATLEKKTPVQPKLIDAYGIAQLLTCSQRHVYRMEETGQMPPRIRLGALVRWNRDVVEAWIANGCPPVNGETSV